MGNLYRRKQRGAPLRYRRRIRKAGLVMSYDRWGRTPEMAKRERAYEWLCIAALGLVVAGIVTLAALVVMLMSA